MSYLVLARKYRPRTFNEIAGQPAAAKTLTNAIALDRVAHAYLFAGPRGVGKTSMARILAKALCCTNGPSTEPCGTCERCDSIQRGNDLDVIEIDAASNRGIDDVRSLREKARVAPMRGDRKIYIVDEAHQLTSEAFNALLKILEEPPRHVIFVLATTEPEKLPDTIRSRCQCFEFRRVPEAEIAARLEEICANEHVEAESAALASIARAARGGMRDAQSLLDQVITHDGGKVTLDGALSVTGTLSAEVVRKLLDATLGSDFDGLLEEIDRLDRAGVAAEGVLDALLSRAREILVACATGNDGAATDVPPDVAEQARSLDVDRALIIVNLLLAARRRIREHDEPRLVLEASLLRIARSSNLMPLGEAIAALRSGSGPTERARSEAPRSGSPQPGPTAPPTTPPAAKAPPPARHAADGNAEAMLAAIVAELQRTNGGMGAFLRRYQAMGLENDTLTVAASAGGKALYDLGESRVRTLVAETSRTLFGRVLILKEVKHAGGVPEAVKPRKNPLVDKARQMFDGEEVS